MPDKMTEAELTQMIVGLRRDILGAKASLLRAAERSNELFDFIKMAQAAGYVAAAENALYQAGERVNLRDVDRPAGDDDM